MERTVDSIELDWNLLYERQQNWSRWNNWVWRLANTQGRDTCESVDGDDDTARDAHSWSDREERDGYEVRLQVMEARVSIPSRGRSTKDFLPDLIRGWLVVQRPGLGCTENTPGRSRIVEALRQRWPDHGLLVYDGDHELHRDRKMRAYVQGATDEWETGDASERNNKRKCWNANESRASWEEIGSWEAEDDQFEGSIAGEDEEEALNLAETQLNEALASERNARRTVAQARAIMHDIKGSRGGNPRSANKKGSDAGEGKGTGQSRNRDSRGRAPGHRRMRRRVKLERGLMSLCLHQQDRASSVDLVITNLVSVPRIKSTEVVRHMP